MRAVLDTNVLVSGVFFGGVPGRILAAWRDEAITLVISVPILLEYDRVAAEIMARHPTVDARAIVALIAARSEIVVAADLGERICRDEHDDMFIACAVAASAILVSGDRDLLATAGYRGLRVMRPREFVAEHLAR